MKDQPDIIFIVLDTQRADRLGCYGHPKQITPNLDDFARQGTLFEQAISPAQWTIPSHASFFTGLYPTAHQVTQSSHSLSPDRPPLAESLRRHGYETIGFCNNPLVGILNNGFRRGFNTFYNYGGAIPSLPQHSSRLPWPVNAISERYTQFLRRISYPIQNFFGRSDLAFRISLNAWLTPLWSRFANFKGQNARSVRDVSRYLRQREQKDPEKPLFLFLNLMETHLPFWPPARFIDQLLPYYRNSDEAQRIMHAWNREAYRWAAPLREPLGELESRVLNDMYDAEVAYQDDYLGELLSALNGRSRQENSLTIIVSDHGDGLGEHSYFGHAFVAFQELIHVPLLIQWPHHLPRGDRIDTPVSTRRIYHTILDIAGIQPPADAEEASQLTLLHTRNGRDPEKSTVYSEIYPPMNFVKAIENHQPDLIEPYRCLSLRRAVVQGNTPGPTRKLIQVEGVPDALYNLAVDPLELRDELAKLPLESTQLNQQINQMRKQVEQQRDMLAAGAMIEFDDGRLLQQLRGLGYVD